MKRLAAIAMMLLSPGVVFLAVTMCCVLMPQCQVETHCHEQEGLAVSGSCCSVTDTVASAVTLHGSHFTLTPPETSATPIAPDALVAHGFAPSSTTPIDSSPPVLTLRL